ncbi:MAG: hypothetical protein JNM18_07905 [Planctomycetaceae bacterium]|nr:hypothetical protein [Planctomycetaceae bacterium]
MSLRHSFRTLICVLIAGCGLLSVASIPGVAQAAEPARLTRRLPMDPAAPSVEMFDGMKAGQVDVKMITKDSTEARLLITNRTNQPLNVRLPEAFAGVHVLAQLGGAGVGGGAGGGAQGVGGAGGGAGGAGGGGGGAGFFNIPAETIAEVKVPCVCLEHGKPEPRPQMTYEVRPLEALSSNPAVREVLKQLGQGAVSQRVAQVAAWHYANNMSWEELASKQIKRLSGEVYAYFNTQEMQTAFALGTAIEKKLADGDTVEGQSLSKSPTALPKQ